MRTTNAVLNEDQENDLRDYLRQRLASLRIDNIERIQADQQSWLTYENDAKQRALDSTSIFSKSNVHLPITAMIVDYFLGRTEDTFPEEDEPFFNFKPVGNGDHVKAGTYNHYFNWKIDQKGGASPIMRDGLTHIYVQRAAIFKCAYKKDVRKWLDTEALILWDTKSGQPVLTPQNGFVIKDEDGWSQEPDPVAAASAQTADDISEIGSGNMQSGESMADRQTAGPDADPAKAGGMPMQPPAAPVPMRTVLTSDPSVVWDGTRHRWDKPPTPLKREETLFEGAQPQIVDYDRFLCPAMAESTDSADCIAETYDKNRYWYQSMWLERPWARWADFEDELKNSTANAKTNGENKSKENLGFDDKNGVRKVVEFWVRYDAMGWGDPQNLCVFYDEDADKLIYYEFAEKMCPDRKRPYVAIAIGKTKKRWWGKSMPEKVAQYQDKIDRNFNAEAYRNEMNANPLKGLDPSATVEEEEDLDFSPEKIYHLKNGKTMDDFFSSATLPNVEYNTAKIADLVLWFVQRWLHMSNTNMGEIAQTNGGEAQTATGEEINQEENGTMARRWNRRITTGYTDLTKKLVQLTAALLPSNQKETYEFFEGEDVLTGTLTGADISGIDMNVQLVINPKYTAKLRRQAEQVMAIVTAYFIDPPEIRLLKRPSYIEVLESIGCLDGERLLPLTLAPAPIAPSAPIAKGGEA